MGWLVQIETIVLFLLLQLLQDLQKPKQFFYYDPDPDPIIPQHFRSQDPKPKPQKKHVTSEIKI